MSKTEGRIPSVTSLTTTAALTAVEIKLFNVSSLVKKQIMMQKYQTLKNIFTTSDYNKFTRDILDAMIKWKTLVDKSSVAEFINNAKLNKKVGTLATKGELQQTKISYQNYKPLIQVIFMIKVILKMMAPKIV